MEHIATIISSIGDISDAITSTLPKVIATCSIITAAIPKPESGWLLKIYQAINYAALNVGKAKNAE